LYPGRFTLAIVTCSTNVGERPGKICHVVLVTVCDKDHTEPICFYFIQVATTLLVAGPTLTLCIPGQSSNSNWL